MTVGRLVRIAAGASALAAVLSCSPLSRHAFLSTLLDGYPTLPPAEEYCAVVSARLQTRGDALGAEETAETGKTGPSSHQPYATKACDDCHDRSKPDGLRLPVQQLCLDCHPGLITGSQVHGPVAVRDCLACHQPHSASHPALLKVPRDEVCDSCHQEARLAAGLHARMRDKKLACMDCHDPHSSNATYFLK